MKIASFTHQGRDSYGIVTGEQIIDLHGLKDSLGQELKEAIARNRLGELSLDSLTSLPRLNLTNSRWGYRNPPGRHADR